VITVSEVLELNSEMKIQLDTINKTITIEEDVNLHDFYEQINAILPDGRWREFTLMVSKIAEWREPITITTPQQPINPYGPLTTNPINPYGPFWYETITCNSNEGVFNFNFEGKS
jgi:hypothetical protein